MQAVLLLPGARLPPGPGSHRGGAWQGARVWFEISATGPGLPRDLAARSWDKHWKVGRASQAHKEPSVVNGGHEGAICPEVWVCRLEAEGCLLRAGTQAREGWVPRCYYGPFALDPALNPGSIRLYAGWPVHTCVSIPSL